MKALLKVGYGCNEHCTFCHTQDVRHIDGSNEEVEAKIDRAKALGHTMVVLSGGESTIRPEFFSWARRIASHDLDLGLVTNGLVLAYPDVVERLIDLRLRYVYMSLHGGEARVHNRLVRRDSFDAATEALRNLSGRGLELTANCVVTRQNVEHLDALVDHVAPLKDVRLKFSWVEPKGGAARLDTLVPPLERAADAVMAALRRWDETTGRSGWAVHGGFPLCALPGFEARYDDLRTHGYWTMSEIGEPDLFPVDDRNKSKPPPCEGCALRGGCPGLFNLYAQRHGHEMLRPRRDGVQSNSVNFVYEHMLTASYREAEPCPVWSASARPYDRARHVFVRHGPKVGRYRALSRDFDDDQLEHMKFVAGQLYLDASRKAAPDDFARDLVKLERSALCRDCPAHDTCAGMFEPRFEDVFGRDDEPVRAHLRSLRGEVLDVGCGEMPYADALEPGIDSGAVRYLGIDPDASALRRVGDRLPRAELHAGVLADLDAGRTFDHVLVLRSWNHLPDPDAFAQRVRSLLRPGGSLLVVDNVAFALARTPAQTRRAQSSTARWEHCRNDDDARAHAALARSGLELTERRGIEPERSNQWMLLYTRAR
ncbi:MAG: radical SAM protein [Nannocystaceae bacterium]|nr:radical SAM protein [bacterium]